MRKVVLAVQLWWVRGERVGACVGPFAEFRGAGEVLP